GPAGPKAREEMGDASRGLLEYWNAGRFVMGAPVGRIVVLIGVKILVGIGRHDFAHGQDRAVRAGERIGQDKLRAVSLQNSLPLFAGVFREAEFDAVTKRGGD